MLKEWIDLFFQVWSNAVDMVKKPFGVLVFIGLLLVGSFSLTFWQRNVGYEQAKHDDSIIIAEKNTQIASLWERTKNLETKVDTLNMRIGNVNCLEQSEKVFDLLNKLKKSEERALQTERERTTEIKNTLEKTLLNYE